MKGAKRIAVVLAIVIISVPTFFYFQNVHRKNVGKDLMIVYLDKNKFGDADENKRLLDYKIIKINIIENNISGFVFSVVYSVKPERDNSNWIAGTGKIENDGWIHNKYQEVTVVKVKGKYTIKSMGTA